MPGIIDAHVHPLMGGIKVLYECNFPFTATPVQVKTTLTACAQKSPAGAWIRGGQWGSSFFVQNKLESPKGFLDAVTTTHPIFLNDDSGHNGWVNSAALKAAGLTKASANPDGGTIVRGADGEPNGVLMETAARIFDKVIPGWTDDQFVAAAKEATRLANTYGITSIKDAGAFHPAGMAFSRLDKAGGLTLDVAGDASVHAALDAIAAARKANGNSHLHHELAHAGYIELSDIPRFAQLDAVPDFSPIIWFPSPIIASIEHAIGPSAKHYWPTRSLLDAGAVIASGSDWPAAVPDENPWMGIEALVTRKDPRGVTPGQLWPEQAIKLDEALKIYTLNGARALKLEKHTGSIEAGKSAQIIVLDRNLFKIPADDIGDTKVQMTYFEGKLVYAAH